MLTTKISKNQQVNQVLILYHSPPQNTQFDGKKLLYIIAVISNSKNRCIEQQGQIDFNIPITLHKVYSHKVQYFTSDYVIKIIFDEKEGRKSKTKLYFKYEIRIIMHNS